jgi:membrane protein
VFHSPIYSLWHLHGIPLRVIVKRTWRSIFEDRVLGHAAELGFYFLFAFFPTLLCASSALGLAARSAHQFYDKLLDYMAVVIPTSAMGTVLKTFNETAAAASSGKITFGLIAAVWSASVGISAIQDTLNAVYNIEDSRSYLWARVQAIGLTVLITIIITLGLASLLAGDYFANSAGQQISQHWLSDAVSIGVRVVGWMIATVFLILTFAILYNWAPDCRSRWHWLTPGATVGIVGWLLASVALRVYLYFFNTYTLTYGSLGAVIILLMWFYITGLMLLLGAEINSQIEAGIAEKKVEKNAPISEEPPKHVHASEA